ncbi:Mitochondrial distribution and morphology protein 12 [Basidiobolus ranarum]|uniref:1-phosphatidylinositol-3-phosphate 5-kinase n=1 Tax=Basidiobolus ranarum TaxID=34480 RepID=A0ABR2X2Q9_9FUNG
MVFSREKRHHDRIQPPLSDANSFVSFDSLGYDSEGGDSGVISKIFNRVKSSLNNASVSSLNISHDSGSNFYQVPSMHSNISVTSTTSIPDSKGEALTQEKGNIFDDASSVIIKAFIVPRSDVESELELGEEPPSHPRTKQLQVTNKSSFSNIVRRLRGEGINKDYWMKDDHCKECYECKDPFTTFRRKHHCRICGQIFCSKCSSKIIPGERFGYPGLMRVCNYCSSLISTEYPQDHESLDSSSIEEPSVSPPSAPLPILLCSSDTSENAPSLSTQALATSISNPPKLLSRKLSFLAPPAHVTLPNSITPTVALSNAEPTATYALSSLIDASSVEGFKRMLSGGANIFNRSRANTFSEESGNDTNFLAPFHNHTAEYAKYTGLVDPNLLIDPEIAPFMSDDEDESPFDSWITIPANFVPTEAQMLEFSPEIGSVCTTPIPINEGQAGEDDSLDMSSMSYPVYNNKEKPSRGNFNRDKATHPNHNSPLWRSRSPSFHSKLKPRNFMGSNNGHPHWSKGHRHHQRVNSTPVNVEINAASLQHIRKLLLQTLNELEADVREGWEQVLMKFFLKLSDSVRPNVRSGDDIDIRNYIKIKKIPGGSPADCEYVNGFVCTKNLAHKRMPRILKNPRIMILTFSLEYHRVDNQYLSLEPVLAQEREHLKNLVARVVALRPTLIIVEKSVSRLALEFLMKANVAVAFNVKPTVVQTIARFTRADVISSIDKLSLEPRLGRCGTFSLRTFAHELIAGKKKTFMFFEECPKELGCSIILRGGNMDMLSKIKQLTNLMAFVAFNLKLESCLLRDQFALNPVVNSETERLFNSRQQEESEAMITVIGDDAETVDDELVSNISIDQIIAAIKPFETKILSASPFVKFPLPYLLSTMRDDALKLIALKRIRKNQDVTSAHLIKIFSEEEQGRIRNMTDIDYRDLIQEYISNINAGENYLMSNNFDISPFAHQNILVLYFNICKENTTPCQAPEIHPIEYYRKTDVTLGQYLEELCFDSNYVCPSSDCDKPLKLHFRSYAHGDARVTVKIEDSESRMPGIDQTILMWSHCKICKKDTPVVPMSEETWNISFGKYMELTFYRKDLSCRAGICPHNIHREHIRLFALSNLVVRFEYEPIELLELEVPSIELKFKSDVNISLKNDDIEKLRIDIVKYWDSVAERLKTVTYENVTASKLEACKQEIGEMIQKMVAEKTYFLQMLQQTYDESLPTDTMTLNEVVRILQEKVIEWDEDFSEMATKYFPADRKLSTAQFKKLFPEKEFTINGLESLRGTLSKDFGLDGTTLMVTGQPEEYFKPKLLPLLGSSPTSSEFQSSGETFNDIESPESNNYETDNMVFSSLSRPLYRKYSLQMMREFKEQQRTLQRPKLISQGSHSLTSGNSKPRLDRNESGSNISQRSGPSSIAPVKASDSPNQATTDTAILSQSAPQRISRLLNPTKSTAAKFHNITEKVSRLEKLRPRSNKGEGLKDKKGNLDRSNNPKLPMLQTRIASTGFDKQRIVDRLLSKVQPLTRSSSVKRVGKPVIEVYSNAKDAVTEDSDDEYEISSGRRKKDKVNEGVHPFSLTRPDAFDASLGDEDYYPHSGRSSLEEFIYDGALTFLGKEGDFPPPSPPRSPYPLDAYSDRTHSPSPSDIQGSSLTSIPSNHLQIDNELPGTAERLSLMKTITNFWGVGNSANFQPLEYPLIPTEHIFPDSLIIVREDEPSSIIAFTLSSRDYKDKLESMLRNQNLRDSYVDQGDSDCEEVFELNDASDMNGDHNSIPDIEETLLRPTGTHIKYQFSEGSTTLFCKIFYAEQFDALRRQCGCEETYLESLARCVKWSATGGKSGSAFLKTRDDRLIMKQMSRSEMDAFLKFAPYYFEYLSKAFFHELPTLLAKIYGFYRIGYKNLATGRSMKIDVLIMENIFYQRKMSRIFDLKGSTRNRHVQSTGNENEVLLDENLMEFAFQSPLFIREHSKNLLRTSVWNDTLFLFKRNVMDYSLLVGIDEEKHELVIGIVDFIRTFTWDKKLESWVKESGILGGGGKEPTIVSPRQYKVRFREAMERYFLMVPDKFCDPNSIRKGTRAAPNL